VREWICAVLLALAAGAITKGVSTFSTGAAWIVGGALFGLLAWLVVAE
jgi:hypothetical protein